MTSVFEQQEPLANLSFIRTAASPRPAGVKLPPKPAATPVPTPRPPEPRSF